MEVQKHGLYSIMCLTFPTVRFSIWLKIITVRVCVPYDAHVYSPDTFNTITKVELAIILNKIDKYTRFPLK